MVDAFLKYLEFEKRYSKHTISSYRNDLSGFIQYLISSYDSLPPEQANYPMIRSWILTLVEENIAPKSVNRKIACLRSFYHFLLKKEYLSKDPTLKIRALKVKKSLPVFVEESALIKLLDKPESDDFEGLRKKMILELLYGTGIRLSELIGLREQDINIYQKSIKVLGKGNKERIIPVNDSLFELMRSYAVKKKMELLDNLTDFFIVTNEGKQAYPMFIYRVVRSYLDSIPLDKKSPHVLRHTFATHLLNKGADLNAIKDLLGHSSLAATQVYTHNSIEKLKNIFDQAHPKS